MNTRMLIGLCWSVALLCPLATLAQSDWVDEALTQRRLSAGEVVVRTASAIDPAHPRGWVLAAVLIKAPAEVIWPIMIDCKQAPQFVPSLKHCRRIGAAADGSWEDFEQEVQYSWFLPTVRYVFRAEYERPHRIRTRRISGDLKAQEGTWQLTPSADGTGTLVQYAVYVDPGFWIPQSLVNRSLLKDLPAALAGLRQRAESANAMISARERGPRS